MQNPAAANRMIATVDRMIQVVFFIIKLFYCGLRHASPIGGFLRNPKSMPTASLHLLEGGFLRNPLVCRRHPCIFSLRNRAQASLDSVSHGKSAEGGGFEPPVRLPVRQFSKLLVSATHPSFPALCANIDSYCLNALSFEKRLQRYCFFLD